MRRSRVYSDSALKMRVGFIIAVMVVLVSASKHHQHSSDHDHGSPNQHRTDQNFDFFYFVQQWPGAYCDSQGRECCYPKTGKPATDFGIHGLWPNYEDGSYPSNCDSQNRFDEKEITEEAVIGSRLKKEWASLACPSSDGIRFWSHEWSKHGTCAESAFSNQRDYFKAALDLKDQTKLLESLQNVGIQPNDQFYNLEDIKQAIQNATGFEAWIECNHDQDGNNQIYQVYMCVDKSGNKLINCPVIPRGNCPASRVQFPIF